MAIAPLIRIPTLTQRQPFVDSDGRLTSEALRTINDILRQLAEAINQLAALPLIQQALAEAQDAIVVAQAAAETAQDAADAAQGQAAGLQRETALVSSYIEPDSVVTATPTDVAIAAHVRRYADGTSASVNAGTAPATAAGDTNYVFYDDPARTGGTVAYQTSTTAPVQTGDRHVVGAVVIPAAGTATGGRGPRRPGEVEP